MMDCIPGGLVNHVIPIWKMEQTDRQTDRQTPLFVTTQTMLHDLQLEQSPRSVYQQLQPPGSSLQQSGHVAVKRTE